MATDLSDADVLLALDLQQPLLGAGVGDHVVETRGGSTFHVPDGCE